MMHAHPKYAAALLTASLQALGAILAVPCARAEPHDQWTVFHTEGLNTGAISISTASVSEKTKAVLTLSCKTGKHFSLTLVGAGFKAKGPRPALLIESENQSALRLLTTMLEPNALFAEDASAAEKLILASRKIGIRIEGADQEDFFALPDAGKARPLILMVCPLL